MTDTITTSAGLGEGTMTLPPAPVVADRRIAFSGELDRVHAELADAQRKIAEQENTIRGLRNDQITDGSDHRLVTFWERAERVANAANFCEEYDRIAEGLNGPRREREYEVTIRATIEWTTTRTSRDEEDAGTDVLDDFDSDTIAEAARDGSIDIIDSEVYDTTEI